jgi:hypothetical protein
MHPVCVLVRTVQILLDLRAAIDPDRAPRRRRWFDNAAYAYASLLTVPGRARLADILRFARSNSSIAFLLQSSSRSLSLAGAVRGI